MEKKLEGAVRADSSSKQLLLSHLERAGVESAGGGEVSMQLFDVFLSGT